MIREAQAGRAPRRPAPRPRALRATGRAAGALVPLALALGGCAGPHPPAEVERTLERTVDAARAHHEAGHEAEAYELVRAALDVAPERRDALALRAELPEDVRSLFDRPVLGANFARRPAAERSIPARVALYLPDRVLDLLDLVSFDVHVGPGLYANVHATRALQLGAGARSTLGLGWHDHRSLGLLAQSESGLVVGPVGGQAYAGSLAGTSGVRSSRDAIGALHGPGDGLYLELRDYWAVGESLTLVVVGLDVELHLVEVVDFALGFATVDLLNDDFGGTRGLRLEGEEERLLDRLGEYRRSEETMERYRRARPEGAVGDAGRPGG